MVPPVLIIMEKYLTVEATEALENRDYDEVLYELNEVSELFEMAADILKNMGLSEETRNHFSEKLENAIKICKGKNHVQIEPVLLDLKEGYEQLLGTILTNNK